MNYYNQRKAALFSTVLMLATLAVSRLVKLVQRKVFVGDLIVFVE